MSEILSEREAEEWWRWMVRVGAQESNSLRVSHEALRARVAEYLRRAAAAEARLAEVEQALREYGEHDPECDYLMLDDGACDCGFAAVLEKWE